MTKKEIIWREILVQATEKKKLEFTQQELAKEFNVSLSTVFNALKIPRQAGAVKVTGRNFFVADLEKFLYFWATQRNIGRETAYKTRVSASAGEIEGLMPPGVVFGAMSAYAKKYGDPPADYDKVFVYADPEEISLIKKRFPAKKGSANLVVLKKDPYLQNFGYFTPDVQTFVDLWNLEDWYAKDFLNKLKEKILA